MEFEVCVRVIEVVADKDTGLLTADQARAISNNWQDNEIGKAIEQTLSQVKEQAHKGAREALVNLSNRGLNMDIATYVKAVKSLGYELKRRSGYWFTWVW